MTLKIRTVTIEDLEAVTAVEASCFPAAEAATRTAFEQRIKVFPENFFVAEQLSIIAGGKNRLVQGRRDKPFARIKVKRIRFVVTDQPGD